MAMADDFVPDHCWPASWVVAFLLGTKGLIQVCTTSDNSDAAGTVPLLRGPSVRISFFTHGGAHDDNDGDDRRKPFRRGLRYPRPRSFSLPDLPFPDLEVDSSSEADFPPRRLVNPDRADIGRSVCSVRFLFHESISVRWSCWDHTRGSGKLHQKLLNFSF